MFEQPSFSIEKAPEDEQTSVETAIENISKIIKELEEENIDDSETKEARLSYLQEVKSQLEIAQPSEDEEYESGEKARDAMVILEAIKERNVITEEEKIQLEEQMRKIEEAKNSLNQEQAISQAYQELDRIDEASKGRMEDYNTLIAKASEVFYKQERGESIEQEKEDIESIKKRVFRKFKTKNPEQARQEAKQEWLSVLELKETIANHQLTKRAFEDEIEQNKSLLNNRSSIEELIKKQALQEDELRVLDQALAENIENLDKIIPEKIREQAREAAQEIELLINEHLEHFGDIRSFSKEAVQLFCQKIERLFKLSPENIEPTKKIIVKLLQAGVVAGAVLLLGGSSFTTLAMGIQEIVGSHHGVGHPDAGEESHPPHLHEEGREEPEAVLALGELKNLIRWK